MILDIAIIGCGLSGLSLAHALKHNKRYSIGLFGQQPAGHLQIDNRDSFNNSNNIALNNHHSLNSSNNIVLNNGSIDFFKSINLWDKISPKTPIQTIHVSMQGYFGSSRIYPYAPYEQLGIAVPESSLYDALRLDNSLSLVNSLNLKNLSNFSNIENSRFKIIPQQVKYLEFSKQTQQWTILTNDDLKMQAKLIIAADGSNSYVREALGINITKDIEVDKSLVMHAEFSKPHSNVAYERFIPKQNAILALIPTWRSNNMKLIYSAPINIIDKLEECHQKKLEDCCQSKLEDCHYDKLINLMQQDFGYRLGKLTKISNVKFQKSGFIRSNELVKNNAILIGNAANTLHPVGAQGFNLAIRDIIQLCKILNPDQSHTDNNLDKILPGNNLVQIFPDNIIDQSLLDKNLDLLQKMYSNLRVNDHLSTRLFTKFLAKIMPKSKYSFFTSKGIIIMELLDNMKSCIVDQAS